MIVGDLGSVVLSQALQMPVGRCPSELMNPIKIHLDLEFQFSSWAGDADFDMHHIISVEPLGKIRSFDADLHSINRILSFLLSLCKNLNIFEDFFSPLLAIEHRSNLGQSPYESIQQWEIDLLAMVGNLC